MRHTQPKHRIVVVEDDNTSKKLLHGILEKAGYDVIDCSEGIDALHIAEMYPPRVMLVDVMLPDMKGTDIVEELAPLQDFKFTKFVFLTGILSKKSAEKSYYFKLQGERYRALQKPIRKGQLLKLLGDLVQQSIDEEKLHKLREEDSKEAAAQAMREKLLALKAKRLAEEQEEEAEILMLA